MIKTTLYIASSIDGYIATKDHSVDWLSVVEDGEEDYGYNEFYNNIDAIVMGRKTYDFILQHSDWPYAGKQSFVFTSQKLITDRKDIEFLHGDIKTGFNKIISSGHNNIWLVGGGLLNTEFLNNNLIDEIILSIIPIVLGEGIPLFPKANQQVLKFIQATNYKSGLVQLKYEIDNKK